MIKTFRSPELNFLFNTSDGFTATWGRTKEEDALFSPFGPMILDIELSTICHRKCNFCFLKGTLVLTSKGYIDISKISVGNIVYSYDENAKQYVECSVEQVHKHNYSGEILVITIDNNKLFVTPEHELYTTNRAWVKAKDLVIGDDILSI